MFDGSGQVREDDRSRRRTSGCPSFSIPMIGKGRECSDQSDCHEQSLQRSASVQICTQLRRLIQPESPQRITPSGMFESPFTPLADVELSWDFPPYGEQKMRFHPTVSSHFLYQGYQFTVEGTSWPSRLSTGELGQRFTAGPAHLRCCFGSCSEELKMNLGLVLDASGRIGASDERKQVPFVDNLLDRVHLALNKAHVAMIKFSTHV